MTWVGPKANGFFLFFLFFLRSKASELGQIGFSFSTGDRMDFQRFFTSTENRLSSYLFRPVASTGGGLVSIGEFTVFCTSLRFNKVLIKCWKQNVLMCLQFPGDDCWIREQQ